MPHPHLDAFPGDRSRRRTPATGEMSAPDPDPDGGPDARRSGTASLRALASAGTLAVVGMVLSAIFQFALAVVVTRLDGAAGAGLFFETIALFTIIATVGELGAHTGLVWTLPRYRALGRAAEIRNGIAVALCPVVVACTCLALLLYVLAPRIADLVFHDIPSGQAVANIRLLAPFLPLAAAMSVALAATRGLGTMYPYVAVQNVALPVARPVLVVAGVMAGLETIALPLGWAAPIPFGFVVAMLSVARLSGQATSINDPRPVSPRRLAETALEFWRFAAPRGLAAVFGTVVTWLDTLLIGILRSTAEAGFYAAASRLAIVGAYALQAVGMAVAPQLSELMARERWNDAERVYQVATWWLIALTWPLYIMMGVFAPVVLSIFGSQFRVGAASLAILSLAMLVNLGTGNVVVLLLMSGRSSWHLFNTGVSVILNVVVNLLLIPRHGISGAALAWAVSIVWSNMAALVEVRVLLGIRPFGSGYRLVSVGAALCYGGAAILVRWTLGPSFTSVLLAAVVATCGYLVVLWRGRRLLEFEVLREALSVKRRRSPRATGELIEPA